MKMNHVHNPKFWDDAVNENKAEFWILDGFTPEQFWSYPVDVPGLTNEMRFLDIGCGIGRAAKVVSPQVKKYIGIDTSSRMIDKAKEIFNSYKNTKFICNDGNIPLPDNYFDYVYTCLVFQHMPKENAKIYFNEIKRVLKQGGILKTEIPRDIKFVNGFNDKEIDEILSDYNIIKETKNDFYRFVMVTKK